MKLYNDQRIHIQRPDLPGNHSMNCKMREAESVNLKQEALTAWASFQATGQHLTFQELRDWLNTRGKDIEAKIPECHD